MEGIEKITARIAQDADAEIARLNQQTQEQIREMQDKAQAQADIAEDGYWGVGQTSDRIIQFATALTGGDPDKIEAMRDAFKKGYAQAEKTWGGSLPEISQKTYDAVMEKFDKLAADAGLTTEG